MADPIRPGKLLSAEIRRVQEEYRVKFGVNIGPTKATDILMDRLSRSDDDERWRILP